MANVVVDDALKAGTHIGPVAVMIRAKDYEQALAVCERYIFRSVRGHCTTSLKFATHFKRNAEVGMVMVNLPTAGVDYHVPSAGAKARDPDITLETQGQTLMTVTLRTGVDVVVSKCRVVRSVRQSLRGA